MEAGFSSLIGQLLNGWPVRRRCSWWQQGCRDLWRHPHRQLCARLVHVPGLYVAYTLVERLSGSIGFWPALLLAPRPPACWVWWRRWRCGRIYRARSCCNCWPPCAGAIVKDGCCGPGARRAVWPSRAGAGGLIQCSGGRLAYDLLLIAIGPVVLAPCGGCCTARAGARWRARPRKTARWSAPWANQAGCSPACLPWALCWPGWRCAVAAARARQPGAGHAHHWRRLRGGGGGGMGLLPGAFAAAMLIAEPRQPCIRSVGRGGAWPCRSPAYPGGWNLW